MVRVSRLQSVRFNENGDGALLTSVEGIEFCIGGSDSFFEKRVPKRCCKFGSCLMPYSLRRLLGASFYEAPRAGSPCQLTHSHEKWLETEPHK